jgi:hypothetical protein
MLLPPKYKLLSLDSITDTVLCEENATAYT